MNLPGYDAWKLASPPEYEARCECGESDCDDCERTRADEAAYDRHVDQKIDEARERERDR